MPPGVDAPLFIDFLIPSGSSQFPPCPPWLRSQVGLRFCLLEAWTDALSLVLLFPSPPAPLLGSCALVDIALGDEAY